MENPGILHAVARLDSRAVRAEQAHAKLEQDVKSLQESLKQSREDFDHVARLLEIFFDLNQRTGAVLDYLLRERGAQDQDGEPQSIQIILGAILKEMGEEDDTEQN